MQIYNHHIVRSLVQMNFDIMNDYPVLRRRLYYCIFLFVQKKLSFTQGSHMIK